MTGRQLRQRNAEHLYNVLQAVTALLDCGAPQDEVGCCWYCDTWLEAGAHSSDCAWAMLQHAHTMRFSSESSASTGIKE